MGVGVSLNSLALPTRSPFAAEMHTLSNKHLWLAAVSCSSIALTTDHVDQPATLAVLQHSHQPATPTRTTRNTTQSQLPTVLTEQPPAYLCTLTIPNPTPGPDNPNKDRKDLGQLQQGPNSKTVAAAGGCAGIIHRSFAANPNLSNPGNAPSRHQGLSQLTSYGLGGRS